MSIGQHRSFVSKLSLGLGTLLFALLPATSFAERPEIDCESISPEDAQNFETYKDAFTAELQDGNFGEALPMVEAAMSICTTDFYTEYTLGRLYDRTGDCASAYYHYEILWNSPNKDKKENREITKQLKKNFEAIKGKCGDVVTLEIQCATEGTELLVEGLPSPNLTCPFYGKVKPGAYTIIATKEGYDKKQENITISEEGAIINLSALEESNKEGFINVRCPRGASSFVLEDSKGKRTKLVCPTLGEKVPVDTYKIYLNDTDQTPASTITVAKSQTVEHMIPNVATSSCSGVPQGGTTAPLAGLFALLGVIGVGLLRRRED